MFGFIKEIAKTAGMPVNNIKNLYKYVNLGGRVLYVQGFLDVLTLQDDLIVLKLKKGELEIEGKNLNIKDINISSITIAGKIQAVKDFSYEK